MIAQLRAQSALVRGLLSVLCGFLAFVALMATNRKLDKRHRQELAGVGGAAVAIIVWLLLLPHGTGGSAVNLSPPGVGNIVIPPGSPVTLSPVDISPGNFASYDPTVLFPNQNSSPKIMTACGCEQRRDAWSGYIASLWAALDQAMPNGPSGGITVAS